jgi:hypothetical protein
MRGQTRPRDRQWDRWSMQHAQRFISLKLSVPLAVFWITATLSPGWTAKYSGLVAGSQVPEVVAVGLEPITI